MRYLDKSFSVPMPGRKAAMWPRCQAKTWDGVVCEKDLGHDGKHKGYGTVGDVQFDVEWPTSCGSVCTHDFAKDAVCGLEMGHEGRHRLYPRMAGHYDGDIPLPLEWE